MWRACIRLGTATEPDDSGNTGVGAPAVGQCTQSPGRTGHILGTSFVSFAKPALVKFGFVLGSFLVTLVTACGGAAQTDATPAARGTGRPPIQKVPAVPTATAHTPFAASAVWKDEQAQVKIRATCFGPRNINRDSERFCVELQMSGYGAHHDAIDFYMTTETWLLGFTELGSMDGGLIQSPTESLPSVALLGPTRSAVRAEWLLESQFPFAATDGTRPFRDAKEYALLLAAAKQKFRGPDNLLDLRLARKMEIESASPLADGGQEFRLQVGIQNVCSSCGIGVAVRYAIAFDVQGELTSLRLLSLCQGRLVTRQVDRVGKATFHEFSGVAIGGGSATEPHLVLVPGLEGCPPHTEF
jgi:hypothetical protein